MDRTDCHRGIADPGDAAVGVVLAEHLGALQDVATVGIVVFAFRRRVTGEGGGDGAGKEGGNVG